MPGGRPNLDVLAERHAIGYKCIWKLVHNAIIKAKVLRRRRERGQEDVRTNSAVYKRAKTYYADQRRDHPELNAERCAEYRVRVDQAARDRERYATDMNYQMRKKLRARVYGALVYRKTGRVHKTGTTFGEGSLTGCTVEEFKAHIEQQLHGGMTLATIQIDHIWPLALYDLSDPVEQRRAFSWRNCRPAWTKENLEKGMKVPEATLGATVPEWFRPPSHRRSPSLVERP